MSQADFPSRAVARMKLDVPTCARLSRVARTAGVTVAMGVLLSACGDALLTQRDPSRVTAAAVEDPAHAPLLVSSAIADFECALAQYVVSGGLVGDELEDAQLGAQGWDHDRRTMAPAGGPYATATCLTPQFGAVYTPLSTARYTADNAARHLEAWTDAQVANRKTLLARAYAYGGYALVLLGEGMCTAAIDGGPELTRAQVLADAEARFGKALAANGDEPAIRTMATIGRARARLGQGNLVGAAADAGQVTDKSFVQYATYSASTFRRENRVWDFMYRGGWASVDVPFRSVRLAAGATEVADPRVAIVKRTLPNGQDLKGADGRTTIYAAAKYATIDAKIPIARYAEAALIVAEATGGQTAVAIINDLRHRAGVSPSADFASSDAAVIRAQVIEERRRELFLEGQRLGDLIRLSLPLYPATGSAFTAEASKGGTYGSQVCFPLPDVERLNNPSIRKSS